ncbi:MAG: peptidoglycan recognition protein family protein [Gemmatimonadaceae bacterium]|nr:peptidoglycan recognition protein family protein [Gemmatimonadaceae bacterium]
MAIVPRSKWGAKPARSRTARDPKALKGVVVHWFGSPRGAKVHDGCPGILRSVQSAHMRGEYTDIAYNHAVCPHGTVYELRGFGVQSGANGTRRANREYAAVVVMIGRGDPFTARARTSLRRTIADWRRHGAGRMVVPHGAITGSECPGEEIRAWLDARLYDQPKPKKPKPGPVRVDVDGPAILTNQSTENPALWKRLRLWAKARKPFTVKPRD